MNTDNTTHNPSADWHILGKLELLLRASAEDALYAWLKETLHPLNLQEELLNKIITSAQDAIERAIHAEVTDKFDHVHVTVFVPSVRLPNEQAWGFFRLEKIEDAGENQDRGDHAVELYLYGEGR